MAFDVPAGVVGEEKKNKPVGVNEGAISLVRNQMGIMLPAAEFGLFAG